MIIRKYGQVPSKGKAYQLMDDCPKCARPVLEFTVGYDVYSYNTVTFAPCGCLFTDTYVKDWQVHRFEKAADYNREVITHELRSKGSKKTRAKR